MTALQPDAEHPAAPEPPRVDAAPVPAHDVARTAPGAADDVDAPSGARPPRRASWRAVLRATPAVVGGQLLSRDLAFTAGGLTFYAALAVIPLLLVSGRLASVIVGQDQLAVFGAAMDTALPDALGAGAVAQGLVEAAAHVGWLEVIVAAFPASLYGEGLRRAYTSIGAGPTGERFLGWRARIAIIPVLAAAPALLVGVLAVTPLLARLMGPGSGVGPTSLGVYVALNVDWIAVSIPLAWTFRAVAPGGLSWRAAITGGFATGAFVSGFLQGFTLFLALPIDLGLPFGGLTAVGATIAVLLWMWLLHAVVLYGYRATLTAVDLHRLDAAAVAA